MKPRQTGRPLRPTEVACIAYAFVVPFDIVKSETLGFSVTVPMGIMVIILGSVDAVIPHDRSQHLPSVGARTLGLAVALVFWATASFFWSYNQDATLLSSAALAQNLLIALILGRNSYRVWTSMITATAASSAVIAFAVLASESGPSNRATYGDVDQNTVAFTLCVSLGLSLSLLTHAHGPIIRGTCFLSSILCSGAILLTGSRTGAVAVVLTIVVFGVSRLRRSAGVGEKLALIGIVVLLVWFASRLNESGRFSERLLDFSNVGVAGDEARAEILNSYFVRFDDWWLVGVGQGADIDFLARTTGWAMNAHGLVWKVWIEIGIVGLALFLWLLLGLAWAAVRSPSPFRSAVTVGLTPIVIFALTLGGQTLSAFWLVFGLCIASAQHVRSPKVAARKSTNRHALDGRHP